MNRAIWTLLAAVTMLASCGAGEPPRAAGGMDLTDFWQNAP